MCDAPRYRKGEWVLLSVCVSVLCVWLCLRMSVGLEAEAVLQTSVLDAACRRDMCEGVKSQRQPPLIW